MIEQAISYIYGLPGGRITAFALLALASGAALYLLYKALYALLRKAAEKTRTDLDDRMLDNLRDPVRLLVVSSALFFAVSYAYPDASAAGYGPGRIYTIALMLIAAFGADRFSYTLLEWYKRTIAPKTGSKLDDELIPLVEKLASIIIYVVALLMALSNLGIEITPLLAGLGIASLAVALALQDSLGNFFAGINIAVDRPLKKDDFISTDGAVEGVVQEIGWRSTKILTPQNNIVIIPNTRLAQSVVTNFHLPSEQTLQSAVIGVSYDSDPDQVAEAIKMAVSEAAARNPDIDLSFAPLARLDSFGDFSLNFKYTYAVKNHSRRLAAAGEINRSILLVFRKEGISIPFPTRTIHSYAWDVKDAKGQNRKK